FLNGEVFSPRQIASFQLDPIGLIEGFYEGVLGMKVGETKNIEVPSEKGYTDPEHVLYNQTLYFEVTVLAVVENIRNDPDFSQHSTSLAVTNQEPSVNETLDTSNNDDTAPVIPINYYSVVLTLVVVTIIRNRRNSDKTPRHRLVR
ncbi:MAG: FKBP-type peptidyl-prolyl cis-trans isomerase, partial [Candidatus Heimdallarchaeota archaeon]|nr:FKBP-type peptidyl-prolyl cis-trans isomerase [Candidatus Heimdallarchaeota archaeon]